MLPDAQRFNLGYLGADTARIDPDRTAIVDWLDGAERTLRYGELDRRLDQVANLLSGLGLPRGSRVALLVGNRAEFVEINYGALRAGLVPVMVNTKLGADGLRASIEECGAAVAFVEPACNEAALGVVASLGIVHRFAVGAPIAGWPDFAAARDAAPAAFDPPPLDSLQVADLCFTSGSSGRPKAVMATHRGLLLKLHLYANLMRHTVGGEIRTLVALPIFHANGRLSIGTALQTGGLIVIQPRFDAADALRNLARFRITYFLGVAPAYTAMLKERALLESLDFSSLNYLLVGSAASGGDVLPRIAKALGVQIMHAYGSTEAGTVMQAEPRHEDFRSCGRPLPGVEWKLVDVATGVLGDYGELWIRSEWLALGYWNRPEATAEKFVDGWYRSGDLFQRDADGRFHFRGRVDEMFNVGGEKVYPTEVEMILQQHPQVVSATVVAVPHAEKGEVPAALVILGPGDGPDEAALKAFFLQRGAAYAHPRRIRFVDAFPLLPTGKVDKAAIRRLLAAEDA